MPDRPPLSHPVLGDLEYDASFDWYSGSLPGGVRLSVVPGGDATVTTTHLDRLASDLDGLRDRARQDAAKNLLAPKNETWLGDDEPPLTADAFQSRLGLEGVVVQPGGLEIFFDDGDLFWGHTVIVAYDDDGALVEADIAG